MLTTSIVADSTACPEARVAGCSALQARDRLECLGAELRASKAPLDVLDVLDALAALDVLGVLDALAVLAMLDAL